jgi:hypothetical protein
MTNTFPAYMPQVLQAPGTGKPLIRPFTEASAQTFKLGQVLINSSGNVTIMTGATGTGVATNAIIGIAMQDAGALFTNVSGQPVASQLFGTGQNLATALFPGDQQQCLVALVSQGQQVEFSTAALSGSYYGTLVVGAQVGIAIVSGIPVADASASNKVAVVVGYAPPGPSIVAGQSVENDYVSGDIGWRCIVEFLPVGTGSII